MMRGYVRPGEEVEGGNGGSGVSCYRTPGYIYLFVHGICDGTYR